MTTKNQKIKVVSWQIGLVVVLCLVWQIYSTNWPAPYMPNLKLIATSFTNLLFGDTFFTAVLPSLYRFSIGYLIAVVLGSVIGLTIGYMREISDWVRPVMEYLRFIPTVAILPAALILFGANDGMRIFVIAFGSIFPVILAAMDGARRVEPTLIEVARVNGLSTTEQIVRVILPSALPSIFAGVRIALSIALVMMVISELIASDNGLGFFLLRSQRLFQSANVYAGILVLGLIGFALTTIMLRIENKVLAWHKGWRNAVESN